MGRDRSDCGRIRSAIGGRPNFDIDEAQISAIEYFFENPRSKALPRSVFANFLKREVARRLRHVNVERPRNGRQVCRVQHIFH